VNPFAVCVEHLILGHAYDEYSVLAEKPGMTNNKKVIKDMMSNVRLHATNAFMRSQGVIVNDF
jgi:hypothetical protein